MKKEDKIKRSPTVENHAEVIAEAESDYQLKKLTAALGGLVGVVGQYKTGGNQYHQSVANAQTELQAAQEEAQMQSRVFEETLLAPQSVSPGNWAQGKVWIYNPESFTEGGGYLSGIA